MEIIFQGQQTVEDAAESLISILKLFKNRYGISDFRDMVLQLQLIDEDGDSVELVDESTEETFGIFEVYSNEHRPSPPVNEQQYLQLVVDNTK